MGEIRVNEVFIAGRIAQGPVRSADGIAHFLLAGSREQAPFHCICRGIKADNLMKYCAQGDEVSVEGSLEWMNFPNTGRTLITYAEYVSYGRKLRTLSKVPG